MEELETRVTALEEGVQAAVDKAVDRIRDQLRLQQETETLNERVAKAVAKAFETQLQGLTEKARQASKPGGSSELAPRSSGSSGTESGKGKSKLGPLIQPTSLIMC